jgi:hypothetical protein
MKRLIISMVAIVAALSMTSVALAVNQTPGQKLSSLTTLDACGYFIGTQTSNKSATSGSTYTEKGTWTGVSNNYVNTPVASLGTVTGSYSETVTTTNATPGALSGTESFKSDAGQINQTFSFDGTTWSVTVTATGSLSFLTSSTAGACYTGTFPRL